MRTDNRLIRYSILPLGVLVSGVLLTAGCSAGPDPAYPVSGVVTLNGEALDGGTVIFEPVEPNETGKRYTARATIRSDGRYELSTFSEDDGAVPGEHRVMVLEKRPALVDTPYQPQTGIIPTKYNSPETTDLRYEVRPRENRIDIDVRTVPPTE